MNTKTRKRVVVVLGYLFLAAGLAGLVLPFLQGILFLLVGLLLLSGTSAWATTLEQTFTRRYPTTLGKAARYVQRIKRKIGIAE